MVLIWFIRLQHVLQQRIRIMEDLKMTENLTEESSIKFALDKVSEKVNIHLWNGEVKSIILPEFDNQKINDILGNGKSKNAYIFHGENTTVCVPRSQLSYIEYRTYMLVKEDDFIEPSSTIDPGQKLSIHLRNGKVVCMGLSEFNDQMVNDIFNNSKSKNAYIFYNEETTVCVPRSQLSYIDYKLNCQEIDGPLPDLAEPVDD